MVVATPLLKRRQQVLKPRGSLDIYMTPEPLLSQQQGQYLTRPLLAMERRSGRGLGTGQRHRMGRLGTSDVPSQAQSARLSRPHADRHEGGVPMDRAEERAGPEDVGEQALIRGLDTAFPFFVWGCPCLASGVDR